MCHTPQPLDTCLCPQGHDRPGQLVRFGEVQGGTGQTWGCVRDGGMGLQMGCNGLGGGWGGGWL